MVRSTGLSVNHVADRGDECEASGRDVGRDGAITG
jgi:hypothetical protein